MNNDQDPTIRKLFKMFLYKNCHKSHILLIFVIKLEVQNILLFSNNSIAYCIFINLIYGPKNFNLETKFAKIMYRVDHSNWPVQ